MAYPTFFAAFALLRVTKRKQEESFDAASTPEGLLLAVMLPLFISRSAALEVPAYDVGWTVVAGIAEILDCVAVESVEAVVKPFLEVKHLTASISVSVKSGTIVLMTANASSLVSQFVETGCPPITLSGSWASSACSISSF